MSRIVISDIHGNFKTFKALIDKLPQGVPITIAGDLVDRGLNSREVVDLIIKNKYDCVLGNHEQMMIDETEFKIDKNGQEYATASFYDGIWLMNGGTSTLDSYDSIREEELDSGEKIQVFNKQDTQAIKDHIKWFKTLPLFIEYPDIKNENGDHLLVTHSSPANVWESEFQDSDKFKEDVLWGRIGFPRKIEGIYSVYGHTPQKNGPIVKDHFACIDGGSYFKREGYGKMYALQFPEMIIYEQENIEDKK